MHPDPPAPTYDPEIMISMLDDHVVMSPPRDLDRSGTELLISAAAAAVEAGSTVLVDLDPTTPSDMLLARGLGGDPTAVVVSDIEPVAVLGAGYVRLRTAECYWTIDLKHSRFCQSATPIDPHFVTFDRWTKIRALWVTCSTVSVLTVDGSYLSTRASWTSRTSRAARVDRASRAARRAAPALVAIPESS